MPAPAAVVCPLTAGSAQPSADLSIQRLINLNKGLCRLLTLAAAAWRPSALACWALQLQGGGSEDAAQSTWCFARHKWQRCNDMPVVTDRSASVSCRPVGCPVMQSSAAWKAWLWCCQASCSPLLQVCQRSCMPASRRLSCQAAGTSAVAAAGEWSVRGAACLPSEDEGPGQQPAAGAARCRWAQLQLLQGRHVW